LCLHPFPASRSRAVAAFLPFFFASVFFFSFETRALKLLVSCPTPFFSTHVILHSLSSLCLEQRFSFPKKRIEKNNKEHESSEKEIVSMHFFFCLFFFKQKKKKRKGKKRMENAGRKLLFCESFCFFLFCFLVLFRLFSFILISFFVGFDRW
jgi:hypothetical protein